MKIKQKGIKRPRVGLPPLRIPASPHTNFNQMGVCKNFFNKKIFFLSFAFLLAQGRAAFCLDRACGTESAKGQSCRSGPSKLSSFLPFLFVRSLRERGGGDFKKENLGVALDPPSPFARNRFKFPKNIITYFGIFYNRIYTKNI